MTLTPRAQVLADLVASARAQSSTRGAMVESAIRVFLNSAGRDIVNEAIEVAELGDAAIRARALASLPLPDLLAAIEARGIGEA